MVTQTSKFKQQVRFILRFGTALHSAGAPAHTLESTMQDMAVLMGIRGSFLSHPTAIIASFTNAEEEITQVVRVEPMGVNLGKLSKLDSVAREVIRNLISYEEGLQKLEEILNSTEPYSNFIQLSYFILSASGFMLLFGGNWSDLAAASLVGGLMGMLALGKPIGLLGQLFEAIAAVIASLAIHLLSKLIPQLNVGIVLISSLIIFLPGIFITIAIAEIATNNLVSGTARLVGGVMILLKITFGVFIGSKIASWFHFHPFDFSLAQIPLWVTYATLPLTSLLSVVHFKANKQDWRSITLAGIFGYLCAKLATHYLGPELGMFFGGTCVGAMSNFFARMKDKPSSLFQWPGIVLLVPGSIGYQSMSSLFERDVLSGLDTAFSMVALALALVVGIFFGNILVKPRRAL